MRKNKFSKYILIASLFLLAILFVAKFGGPSILRLYLETGIGNCQKIPILCMVPEEGVVTVDINREDMIELHPRKFPTMEISTPDGFTVVQETIRKVYYQKKKPQNNNAVIYILHKERNFFINLFPQAKKQGIMDNYEFIRRIMYANLNEVKNFTDIFFVIMKSIFTPNLGDEKNLKMAHFIISDKKGFINYNLSQPDNYFDCNVINNEGDFFKIYIKDIGRALDLDKVMAIISTVNKVK